MARKNGKLKDEQGNDFYPAPYFPVGYVYISTVSTNPSTWFGGTWEQIQGKFLLSASSSYAAGTTGGATTHTHTQGSTGGPSTNTSGSTAITISQMPKHAHDQYVTANSGTAGVRGDYNCDAQTERYYQCRTGETGGGQGHTHTLSSHTHTNPTTASASSMPPYLSVYMFKRTA